MAARDLTQRGRGGQKSARSARNRR
jgi:hypothetical protein